MRGAMASLSRSWSGTRAHDSSECGAIQVEHAADDGEAYVHGAIELARQPVCGEHSNLNAVSGRNRPSSDGAPGPGRTLGTTDCPSDATAHVRRTPGRYFVGIPLSGQWVPAPAR